MCTPKVDVACSEASRAPSDPLVVVAPSFATVSGGATTMRAADDQDMPVLARRSSIISVLLGVPFPSDNAAPGPVGAGRC
jgi:hypothetical protein